MANDAKCSEREEHGSICNFMPPKSEGASLEPVSFVYETEIERLRQPFMNYLYCFHITVSGSATLTMEGKSYPLSTGVGFFAFPNTEYTITDYTDFKYSYISYVGTDAMSMLKELNITPSSPVVEGLGDVSAHFVSAVGRVNQANATFLTQSMLLYVLAAVRDLRGFQFSNQDKSLYNQIIGYVDVNFCDPNLSLSKIGEVFSYSEKYVSTLIKKNMKVGFSLYLNRLRIEKAKMLMRVRPVRIGEISEACGFSDALYFSKVFKKFTGKSPTKYIKSLKLDMQ